MDVKKNEAALFDYATLRRNGLAIVICEEADKAARFVTKIMKRHKYHGGDIFTDRPDDYQREFVYPARPASDATLVLLLDIFKRQSGHMSSECKEEDLESMALLDDASRAQYLKQVQPLHFLPRRVFGNALPPDIYQTINKFLIIPETFLVFHHCAPRLPAASAAATTKSTRPSGSKGCSKVATGPTADPWKRKVVQQCLLQLSARHRMTRIITTAHTADLPNAFYNAADYVFIFSKCAADLSQVYKKLKMNALIESSHYLHELANRLRPHEGLVVARSADDLRPSRLYWTTMMTRPKPAAT